MEARRVLLSLQALAEPPAESSAPAVVQLITRLGYVQVDTINVLDRAHHLTLSTRLENYRPAHLAHPLENSRELFEHWTHDACVIPTHWYPHWHHRFARYAKKDRSNAWWRSRLGRQAARMMGTVLARIRAEGPLRLRDFESQRPAQGWWGWPPEKAALEHLWRRGDLAITGRSRFEKIYDLPERVVGDQHSLPASSPDEHVNWACREAMARLGIATEAEIAAFLKAVPVAAVRRWSAAAVKRGEFTRLEVKPEKFAPAMGVPAPSGRPASCIARLDWRDHLGDPDPKRIEILCPFDPVIRDRDRLARLFGFDYRFEAFVPAPKRRFGYFVMPLLEGDRIVGRVDPKFDRTRGVVVVRGPWWEAGVKGTAARRRRLESGLDRLAARVGARGWEVASAEANAGGA